MATATLTLTDFLLARIAEDERDGPWHMDWCGSVGHDDSGCDCTGRARVLAECKAKRRIVDEHAPGDGPWEGAPPCCRVCTVDRYEELAAGNDPECYHEQLPYPCPTLRALAAVYADHPDYQADWRP